MIILAAAGTLQGSATAGATVTYTVMGMELAAGTRTYKVLAQGQLAATTGVLYTAPASTSAMVKSIHLENTGGTAQTISLYVNGSAAANAMPGFQLSANGSAIYDGRWAIYDQYGNTEVAGYAFDAAVVHLAGAETITGRKTIQAELPIQGPRPWIDVTAYGADPTGAVDSAAAFTSALNAANALPHGDVKVPPGDYRLDSGITIKAFTRLLGTGWPSCRLVSRMLTGDVITMEGASQVEGFWMVVPYATTVGGGTLSGTPQTIAMSLQAFLVDFPSSGTGNISLTNGTWTTITWTGKTGTSLTGCTGTGAFSAATSVVARTAGAGINTGFNTLGSIRDMYMQNHFVAIDSGGVSNWIEDVWIRDCISGGILCDIDDGTSYIHNLWLDSIYAQPAFGVRCTQGSVIMSDSNIMRARIGLDFPMAAGGAFSPFVVNCFLDNCADAGMSITGPGSPSVFDRGKFCQCWFSSSTNGVVLNNTGIRGVDFVDCDFYLNTANGISLLAAEEVGIDFCRAANNTTAGINAPVTGGAPDIAIINSLIGPVGTSLTGNGTGIILSGALKSLRIVGNNLAGNTGLALNDTSTVAAPGQKQIMANTGLSVAPRPRTTATTIAAVETVVTDGGQIYLPANSLQVGTTFALDAYGIITATGPTLLPRIRLGTAGTTADTIVCALGATAITTATGWFITALVTIRTLGASGTAVGNLSLDSTTPARTAQSATVTVNTTVANYLSFTLIGGGTTPVITPVNVSWQVVQQ